MQNGEVASLTSTNSFLSSEPLVFISNDTRLGILKELPDLLPSSSDFIKVERECDDLLVMLMVDTCEKHTCRRILLESDDGDESSHRGTTDASSTCDEETFDQKASVWPLWKQLHETIIFPRAFTTEYAPTSSNDSMMFV